MKDPRLGKPFHFGSKKLPGLAKLMEEMGEVQQVLAKILALGGEFTGWNGEDLRKALVEELGDLRASLIFFTVKNDLFMEHIYRAEKKLKIYDEWHEEGKEYNHRRALRHPRKRTERRSPTNAEAT